MTSLEEYIAHLAGLDIKLWLDGERLRVNAPAGAVTPGVKAELAARKQELVAFLEQRNRATVAPATPITPVSRESPLELSFAQQRLWELGKLRGDGRIYHIPIAFRLRGPLDAALLEQSLQRIQQRHESLRTTFVEEGESPRAVIGDPRDVPLDVIDLRNLSDLDSASRAKEQLTDFLREPFDPETGPLWRGKLMRLPDENSVLAFSMHHLIFDGWSKNVFVHELEQFYNTLATDASAELPALPIQYADFAQWHRTWLESAPLAKQRRYWEEQLAGPTSELLLPTDRARTTDHSFEGANHYFQLSTDSIDALQSLSREENVSLFITLATAFHVLLQRYTGQEDQLVCLPVACRNRSELEPLLGYFNNIVVLRSDLSGDLSLREAIRRVREPALRALENQDLPFQDVAEFPNLARTPLTRGMFSFRNTTDQELHLQGIEAEAIDVDDQAADFDLALYFRNHNGAIKGFFTYNRRLFDPSSIVELTRNYRGLLSTMVREPDRKLADLPRLGLGPSDVETRLINQPGIQNAAVVKIEHPPGTRNLAAYLVPDQEATPNPKKLRRRLEQELPDYLIPSMFIPVDAALPMTKAGAVDFAALPKPVLTPDQLRAPAKTPLEKALVEVWKKVLWLDREIGLEDNFFDLGGHSLLSINLVRETETLLGRKLPAEALLKLSTIKTLVEILERDEAGSPSDDDLLDKETRALLESTGLSREIHHTIMAHTAGWRGKRTKPVSLVTGLNPGGPKQALFWCCQGFNELSQLARYLGDDQPIYGMRSGHLLMEKSQANITSLARFYAGEILAVQPEGPFLVGGNCQSAKIAFHIAEHLRKCGHDLTLLCLQEQFVPHFYDGRVALLFGNHSDNNPCRYYQDEQESWRQFYHGEITYQPIAGEHGKFFQEPNVQDLVKTIGLEIEKAQASAPPEPNTSAAPRERLLPDGACRARISVPAQIRGTPGEVVRMDVKITNLSDVDWPSDGEVGLVLGSWCYVEGIEEPLHYELGERLPRPLKAGAAVTVPLSLSIPMKSGKYRIDLDLMDNGISWFQHAGSDVASIEVRSGKPSGAPRWKKIFGLPFSRIDAESSPRQSA